MDYVPFLYQVCDCATTFFSYMPMNSTGEVKEIDVKVEEVGENIASTSTRNTSRSISCSLCDLDLLDKDGAAHDVQAVGALNNAEASDVKVSACNAIGHRNRVGNASLTTCSSIRDLQLLDKDVSVCDNQVHQENVSTAYSGLDADDAFISTSFDKPHPTSSTSFHLMSGEVLAIDCEAFEEVRDVRRYAAKVMCVVAASIVFVVNMHGTPFIVGDTEKLEMLRGKIMVIIRNAAKVKRHRKYVTFVRKILGQDAWGSHDYYEVHYRDHSVEIVQDPSGIDHLDALIQEFEFMRLANPHSSDRSSWRGRLVEEFIP